MSTVTALKRAAEEAHRRLELCRQDGDPVSFDIETLHRVITSPTVLTMLAGVLGEGRASMPVTEWHRPPTTGSSVKPPPPVVVVVRHE